MISKEDESTLKVLRTTVSNTIKEISETYDYIDYKILEVGPQPYEGLKETLKNASVDTLDIDPSSNCTYTADLCCSDLDIPNNNYNVIMCTEVLEHTLNPFKAVDNLYKILKKGGSILVTTPLNFRKHGPSPDCWRFTTDGLKSLFANFEKIKIQEIHNPEYSRFLFPAQLKLKAQK